MTSTDTIERERSRAEIWKDIEQKHFGRCYWQAKSGRCLVELISLRDTTRSLVVIKTYEKAVTRRDLGELSGVEIYTPLSGETWEETDHELAALRKQFAEVDGVDG